MLSGFTPRPLKRLFTANQCWTSFLDAGGLRDIEVEAVTKMLACGTRILGVKEFGCDNPDCQHVKYLTNSCGSRACPSCGKKATDLWTATQLNRLPDCDWVHLVFTLPDTLWPVFESNRWLLNDVCRLAVENLLYAARKRGLEPVAKVCYAQMVKQFLSRDPFECVLCGCRMVYRRAIAGLNVSGLKKNARDISLLRYMPA
uniref:Mobile element protein n=1 Tax=Escherichia coli TaxID=562 RepID=A0A649Z506_ECOLX|nr:transposase zinc-binding domain-containing protein [Escherichia coli]QGM50067.1 Mobile element protein [Escherichia coli]